MPHPKREDSTYSPQPDNSRQRRQSIKGRKSRPASLELSFEAERDRQQLLQQKEHHVENLKDRQVERFGRKVDIILPLIRECGSVVSAICVVLAICMMCWNAVQKPKEADISLKIAVGLASVYGAGAFGLRLRNQTQGAAWKSSQSETERRSTRRNSVESAKDQEISEPEEKYRERRNPFAENEINKSKKPTERRELSLPETPKYPGTRQVEREIEATSQQMTDLEYVEGGDAFEGESV